MKIAIVDDDINMRKSLEVALSDYNEYEILSYKSAKDALKKIDDSIELIITDINMPNMNGIEFLKKLGGKYEAIVITADASLNRAVEALRLGAKDFLTKPFEIDDLVNAINRSNKVKKIQKSKNRKIQSNNSQGFTSNSLALERVKSMALKASRTDVAIMLLGESGVGKEVFASFIHKNSKRANSPFIAINMAAIPENLLESELFGFEKGSFTDALEAKIGKFEAANGGSIFLDEIGEMPYSLQAKLLRVLQEKEITRIGSNKPISLDIRVISATNANLDDKIKNNEFREDLYYRLGTIPVHIPPLRERKDEIIEIAQSYLRETCNKYKFEDKVFSNDAIDELLSYSWPGNIRELLSVVERATIMNECGVISIEDLFLDTRYNNSKSKSIKGLEKKLIQEVLNECNNDIVEASKMLGMTQSILNKKIANFSLIN